MVPDDRQFEVGGEIYEWVTPYWEDLAAIYDEDVQRAITALKEPDEGNEPDEAAETGTHDNIERTQQRIKLFLEEKDHKRWDALCARRDNPVPMHLYGEIFKWLLEVATGRPTQQPSDSEPGAGNGGQSSQAGSRSRAAGRRR